ANPFVRANVARAVARIHDLDGVARVVNPLVLPDGVHDDRAAPLVRDEGGGRWGFVTVVEYEPGLDDAQLERVQRRVDVQLDQIVTGSWAQESSRGSVEMLVGEVIDQLGSDLTLGEGIALPVTFVVMVLVFGGFLAAGIPIVGALAS